MGKDRINWQTDPSPDLAIELDVTADTAAEDYAPYRAPEVWLFKRGELEIYRLHPEAYQLHPLSHYFPDVDLATLINPVFQVASTQGTGIALRELRQRLME